MTLSIHLYLSKHAYHIIDCTPRLVAVYIHLQPLLAYYYLGASNNEVLIV